MDWYDNEYCRNVGKPARRSSRRVARRRRFSRECRDDHVHAWVSAPGRSAPMDGRRRAGRNRRRAVASVRCGERRSYTVDENVDSAIRAIEVDITVRRASRGARGGQKWALVDARQPGSRRRPGLFETKTGLVVEVSPPEEIYGADNRDGRGRARRRARPVIRDRASESRLGSGRRPQRARFARRPRFQRHGSSASKDDDEAGQ